MSQHRKLKLRRLMTVAALVYALIQIYLMRDRLQTLSLPHPTHSPTPRRVAKVSMVYGTPNRMHEGALRSHERHAARWGYPVHVLRHEAGAGFWTKQTYLLATIVRELAKPAGERVEWIMCVEADSVVLNPEIPVEIFLPPRDMADIHVVATRDWDGLTAGVFFVHVHPWSVTMFREAVGYPQYNQGADPGYDADQEAIARLFAMTTGGPDGTGYADGVVYIPRPFLNAHELGGGSETDKGCFLVHFPGTEDLRWPLMARYLRTVETTPSEWEMPLAETAYAKKTNLFWSQVREARAALGRSDRIRPSLDDMTTGTAQDVNDEKKASELLKDTLREQADDVQLMRERLDALHRLRTVLGWESE
ncbi:uncharacterized protein MAM_05518 [Metarhizium album ARSEF 1941]|uniref:Galactosyl transferase n=1 Tax=Metarhizium album (strain ARSEF 1941) TaxID=1081103 RepID=A0A0B2WUF8_METAS|nr:uncharacterized protein MAM_05518 [Metarhizium album ARSEF 1941]KHN96575.1 hypothetical protein MAM_05518 [Metarhizium album ARSEF 1941]